jgi:putative ATP-binding cassette transporter
MQAEAEIRYALTRVRENGESIALIGGEGEERIGLAAALANVIRRWRDICFQYMRTMTVAQTSYLVAPVFPVILSAPKYLDGTMTLGQIMQAASAFVIVQHAFNWIVDNYPRLADWTASARRVSTLLVALDGLEKAEQGDTLGRIKRGEAPPGVDIELRNVSVELDNGTVVVSEADVKIESGDKVLFIGESGSGKSTLIRAIAGLWPWGGGEILMNSKATMFLLPQRPYIPIGPLRRAIIYPKPIEAVSDEDVRQALIDVGLTELTERINEESPWDQTLSGGEKQRVAFARVLIHKPDIVVMDEGTSALDRDSQEILMRLINERLDRTTIISVGHRPELEAFHHRKLTLEIRPGGTKIVQDDLLLAEPESWLTQLWQRIRPRE